jgi:glutathione S-transferase
MDAKRVPKHLMATLYHHPICPHSRFVRVVLAEYGIEPELIEEKPYERRRGFLELNPAGATPVFVDDSSGAIPGTGAIAEYLDETAGLSLGDKRLLPGEPHKRIEVRRLLDWFNVKFHLEVSNWLVTEKVYKRYMPSDQGGGAPDMDLLRAARANIRYHLRYIGWLVSQRNYLAGDKLTYADLAAAAHISSVDFLGDVPWAEDEMAKNWYARVKSRPSFRTILADRIGGLTPSPSYSDLDF